MGPPNNIRTGGVESFIQDKVKTNPNLINIGILLVLYCKDFHKSDSTCTWMFDREVEMLLLVPLSLVAVVFPSALPIDTCMDPTKLYGGIPLLCS